jgi:Rrf2 family cysteine metabolism transcriptional repressor
LSQASSPDYLHLVKLSVKSDYAARAVLSLARHYGEEKAMKVDELAKANGVPANYLVQILIDLKSRNIVRSVRGKDGGYLLARPPGEITLGEVLRTVHGPLFDTSALTDAQCPSELREAWKKLQDTVDQAADSINFQNLAEQSSAKQRMYYI